MVKSKCITGKELEKIIELYSSSSLSLKDFLNAKYSMLAKADKAMLITMAGKDGKYKVRRNGMVGNRYTVKQLAKLVQGYANEDGGTHYILREKDGAVVQTCDPWINYQQMDEYLEEFDLELMETVLPNAYTE